MQHTFAYITAAKSGISETELEDVLSLDDRWDLFSGEVFFNMSLHIPKGAGKPLSISTTGGETGSLCPPSQDPERAQRVSHRGGSRGKYGVAMVSSSTGGGHQKTLL